MVSLKRKVRLAILFIALVSFLVSFQSTMAQTNPGPATEANHASGMDHVYVIPVKQTIETGLEKFLQRSFREAEEAGADFIVIEITTLGGAVDAAANIGELIRLSPIPNAAFIKGRAISAGSYISLNADEIYMDPGSTIGAAAVVDISGEPVQDPKVMAYWIGEMTAAAESSGRNPDYAVGMVDASRVVHVDELDRTYGEGELISFTASQAVQAGYAEGIASSLQEVLTTIGAEDATVTIVDLTPAERVARVLTNPVVMTLLLLVGIAGIGIEIFVPGFGAPGIIGISAFVAYFLGQYAAGFAGIEHILLFIAGVVLLVIEIFVPSFGIFLALGTISLFGSIILAAYDTTDAVTSLVIALITAIVVIVVVSVIFKKRGVWNRFILSDQFTTEEGYVSTSTKEELLGKSGKAVTPLRPSGTVLIDDERVDVVTSGEFIAAGTTVVVRQAEGSRVVVRQLEEGETPDVSQKSEHP